MNVPNEESDGPEPISEEDLSESIGTILNNYRLSVECRYQPYPPKWAITDMMKAFMVYLAGKTDTHPLLLEDLDESLFKIIKSSNLSISGFHDGKSALNLIRGLSMLYENIPRDILLDSLITHLSEIENSTEQPCHMNDLVLNKCASETISSMITSEKVILDHTYLDLIIQLYRDYYVVLTDDSEREMSDCLSRLTNGAVISGNPSPRTMDPDSDNIIRTKYESSFPEKLEKTIGSLPLNRKLIVLDDCGLLTGSKKISQRCLDVLNKCKILSLNRFVSSFSNRSLIVAEISNNHSNIDTRIRIFDDSQPIGSDGHSEEGSANEFDDGTVAIDEIASVRKGVIIGKDELIGDNDGTLAMYIRPKDIDNGELIIDDINYVDRSRRESVMPDSILVDSYPPYTRSYLVRKRDVPCIASPNFSIVIPNEDYDPKYIHAFFRSSMFIDYARKLSSGKYITLADLKSLRIPVASMETQRKIADSVSSSIDDPDKITSAFRSYLSKT